ncbi:MAG: zinc ribbon domain-containing protein [Phycisphaerae bacterium]
MPTYEYACQACDHRFEEFQSMTAKPVRKCPKCGKLKVKRLISAGAGVIFKGSGFYETDYRSKSYSDDAKKDTVASSTPAAAPAAASTATTPTPAPAPAPAAPAKSSKSSSKKSAA